MRVSENLEGATLERMTGPNDYGSRGAFGREVVVGSVSGGLSIRSIITNFGAFSTSGCETGSCVGRSTSGWRPVFWKVKS
jgi:hypothetical protein